MLLPVFHSYQQDSAITPVGKHLYTYLSFPQDKLLELDLLCQDIHFLRMFMHIAACSTISVIPIYTHSKNIKMSPSDTFTITEYHKEIVLIFITSDMKDKLRQLIY